MLATSVLTVLVLSGSLTDEQKVWVLFADKAVTPQALAEAEEGLNDRTRVRRERRRSSSGLVDARDLPVRQDYVDAVAAIAGEPIVVSRWLNAVSVMATPDEMADLSQQRFVSSIRPVADLGRPDVAADATDVSPEGFYGLSGPQISQLGLDALHLDGYTGDGVVIGVLDTGFNKDHVAFNHPDHPLDILLEHDFVANDGETGIEAGDDPQQHVHGTYILGVLGAYAPGTLVGAAYDASYILCKVETVEFEGPPEEDWFVAGLELIEANGGDVATSSVVAFFYSPDQLDGDTSMMAKAFNVATDNGLHCAQGAGNNGHDDDPTTHHLVTPADAFGVISCGAVDAAGDIAAFSSDGPTVDGRLKPEVLSRGQSTHTVHPDVLDGYATASGTSLATPLVAAAVACLTEARASWTVKQMREAVFHGASDYAKTGLTDPLFIRGYGIVSAPAALICEADVNGDGELSILDFVAFQGLFQAGDAAADCNADGELNVLDFVCFQSLFQAGCP